MGLENKLDKLKMVFKNPNMWWRQLRVAWEGLIINSKRINYIRCLPELWLVPAVRWVLSYTASDLQKKVLGSKTLKKICFLQTKFTSTASGDQKLQGKAQFFSVDLCKKQQVSLWLILLNDLSSSSDTGIFCIAKWRLWKGLRNQNSEVGLLLIVLKLS